jgi:NADH:ubiquinone oxidoreductase subunit 6 (subunit J)
VWFLTLGQINGYELFYFLFLSSEFYSYFGPLALVIVGFVLAQKDRTLGVVWFVVECLFIAQYFALLDATPAYWWHIIILLLGGVLVLVPQLMDR